MWSFSTVVPGPREYRSINAFSCSFGCRLFTSVLGTCAPPGWRHCASARVGRGQKPWKSEQYNNWLLSLWSQSSPTAGHEAYRLPWPVRTWRRVSRPLATMVFSRHKRQSPSSPVEYVCWHCVCQLSPTVWGWLTVCSWDAVLQPGPGHGTKQRSFQV